eukprot:TRINITY_DN326_c0_g1_i5.p1 TRINITY_DN326_c0_g1~~TRINITY_DN326_c0_g1_i5.p1  ORF type:complete len:1012 (+),score=277.58 TRINITY_DN326_c0_g1_i5:1134-4169(+)
MSHLVSTEGGEGKVLYDYTATGEFSRDGVSDVSIRKNESITILDSLSPGWIKSKKQDGTIGFIPSNYIKKLVTNEAKATVLEDYIATGVRIAGDCDLSVRRGDQITIKEMLPNGWVKGEVNGKCGVIPAKYVSLGGSTSNTVPSFGKVVPPTKPSIMQPGSRRSEIMRPVNIPARPSPAAPRLNASGEHPTNLPPNHASNPERQNAKDIPSDPTGSPIRSPIPIHKYQPTHPSDPAREDRYEHRSPSSTSGDVMRSPLYQSPPVSPPRSPEPQVTVSSNYTPPEITRRPTRPPAPMIPTNVPTVPTNPSVPKMAVPPPSRPQAVIPESAGNPASRPLSPPSSTKPAVNPAAERRILQPSASTPVVPAVGFGPVKRSSEPEVDVKSAISRRPDRPTNAKQGMSPLARTLRTQREGISIDDVIAVCSKCRKKGHWTSHCPEGDEEMQDEGITFTSHKGKKVIKAATKEKLVERLYCEHLETSDFLTEYMDQFLLTYRTFTNGKEVMTKLMDAFEQEDKPSRIKIALFLRRWAEQHFHDFENDQELLFEYHKCVEVIKNFENNLASMLARAVDKGRTVSRSQGLNNNSPMFGSPSPKPIVPKQMLSLFDIDPIEFARHLTIIESDYFRAIASKELLTNTWTKSTMGDSSPHLLTFITHFNQISCWVSYLVVKEASLKKRANLIIRFLKIAKECMNLNNFNAVFEITSGLQQAAVHRLRKTWEIVKKEKEHATLEEMLELSSGAGSFSAYRTKLRSADPPCVPYVGVYQSDLTFIGDGNNDKLDNGYINFFKRRLVAEIIKEIQTYQMNPYNLQEVPSISEWIKSQSSILFDENKTWEASLCIEPRDTGSKPDKGILSARKSIKLKKSASEAPLKTHSSWNGGLEGDAPQTSTNLPLAQSGSFVEPSVALKTEERKKKQLNKYFGEKVDFGMYTKYADNHDTPRSILDDIDDPTTTHSSLSPTRVGKDPRQVTAAIELSPDQIRAYKKAMMEKFLLEHGDEIDPQADYDEYSGWV